MYMKGSKQHGTCREWSFLLNIWGFFQLDLRISGNNYTIYNKTSLKTTFKCCLFSVIIFIELEKTSEMLVNCLRKKAFRVLVLPGVEITKYFTLSFGNVSKKYTCPVLFLLVLDRQTDSNFHNFILFFGKVSKCFTCPTLFLPVPDSQTSCNFHACYYPTWQTETNDTLNFRDVEVHNDQVSQYLYFYCWTLRQY